VTEQATSRHAGVLTSERRQENALQKGTERPNLCVGPFGLRVTKNACNFSSYRAKINLMNRQLPDSEKPETPDSEPEECEEGLASLLGKYNDDPTWEEIQKHMEERRRQIDELNKG